jgi:hypothetical protein
VVPEARNAAVIFANGAYHQLDGPQPAETHEFDQVFKVRQLQFHQSGWIDELFLLY